MINDDLAEHPDATPVFVWGVTSFFVCVIGPIATWRAVRGLNSFDPSQHSGKEWLVTGLILSIMADLQIIGYLSLLFAT